MKKNVAIVYNDYHHCVVFFVSFFFLLLFLRFLLTVCYRAISNNIRRAKEKLRERKENATLHTHFLWVGNGTL